MTTANPERSTASRPRRRPLTSLAALIALVVTFGAPGLVFAWSGNSFSSTDEALLVQLTNNARAAAGLKALKVDPALTSMARWRSKDMSDRDYFCHRIPPSGATIPADCSTFPTSWPKVFDYLKGSGYCYMVAGENIGTNNFPDDIATESIQQGFMDSPGHRANILGTGWDVIGIGAFKRSNGQHFWTVLFADKCSTAPSPTPRPTPKPTPKPTVAPAPKATPRPTVDVTGGPPTEATDPPITVGPTPDAAVDTTAEPTAASDPTEGPPPDATDAPTTAPSDPADGSSGLQVLDMPVSRNLVDTIVGDVAGAYFGN